ncbi:BcepNY3gp60 [Burkholderia phage BcepNY3]|uniref:BcepNY3gp60 n=1 Tax=Burkholderia phage BcepNY3 TaxID=2881397 RepID=A6N3G8_9CAUD|nr:BcepNY3gp60 [Burkholderia phage BcepNY3]ABR10595.1 BcepNY3gp60 [Burkholderia phage BcepNY3]
MIRTTDESRADALKNAAWRLKRDLERGNVGAETSHVYMADLRVLLEAVEQHEAAPAETAMLDWAVGRWDAEVKNRPLTNVHRRSLDDTWRQVVRHCGGDDVSLIGPRHDDLVAASAPAPSASLEGTGNGADERMAFDSWARDIRMDVSVSLEGHYTDAATAYALAAWRARAAASQPAAEPTIPAELHHDTAKLVRRFARALANKLLSAQRKYGYSDNWMRDDWADECRAELVRHIQKGDPRDVAAYCAFLWHHNESTAAAAAAGQEAVATLHDDGHYTWNPKVPRPDGYDRAGWRMSVYTAPPAQVATRQGLTFEDWFKAELVADRMHGTDEEVARIAWNAARAPLDHDGA